MNQEQNKYFIPDLETGFNHEVSKEQWEAYQKMWEYFRPKIDGVGKILVFGTGGDIDNQDFSEFYGK